MNFSHLQLVIVDFDGVLTDNSVSVNFRGEESYSTNKYDSLGLSYFRQHYPHVRFAVLTSELNEAVKSRCDKLRLPVYQSSLSKKDALEGILSEHSVSPNYVAYIGNDLNDVPVHDLHVSVLACPKDAHASFMRLCNLVLPVDGGRGVLRSFIDLYIEADVCKTDNNLPMHLSKFKSMGHRDWGRECLVTVCTGFYSVKRLFVRKGFSGGLQYHHMKDETGFVLSGLLRVYYKSTDQSLAYIDFSAGDFFRFRPGCIHKEEAIEDTVIIEVSTPHYNDRVRVDSDFGMSSITQGLPSTSFSDVMQLPEYPPESSLADTDQLT
jgi:3-deoxy-D-manno-octulosonate 8-phosphate phosphatase (KDO 8-P phosphatase)